MDKNTLIQFAKETYSLTLLFPKKEPLRWRLREAANEVLADYVLKQNDWSLGLKSQLELIDSYLAVAADQNWTDVAKIIDLRMQGVQIGRDIDWEEPQTDYEKQTQNCPESKAEKCFHMPASEKLGLKEGNGSNDNFSGQISRDNAGVAVKEAVEFAPLMAQEQLKTAPSADIGTESDEEDDSEENKWDVGLTASQVARQSRILEFLKEKGSAQVWEIQKIFPDVSKRTIRRDFRSLLRQGVIERTGERNTIAYKIKVNLS